MIQISSPLGQNLRWLYITDIGLGIRPACHMTHDYLHLATATDGTETARTRLAEQHNQRAVQGRDR